MKYPFIAVNWLCFYMLHFPFANFPTLAYSSGRGGKGIDVLSVPSNRSIYVPADSTGHCCECKTFSGGHALGEVFCKHQLIQSLQKPYEDEEASEDTETEAQAFCWKARERVAETGSQH